VRLGGQVLFLVVVAASVGVVVAVVYGILEFAKATRFPWW
jgi:hypothetical protein